MDQTMGKRIMSRRKALGLTQDQVAEKLGVTAQAVSKWENDQSCPDISMLAPLAQLLGISVDALLSGEDMPPAVTAQIVPAAAEAQQEEPENGGWHFTYDSSRKDRVQFAVIILALGSLVLVSRILHWSASFWELLWPTAMLVYGLFGLYPNFSVFSMGIALAGGYFLLDNIGWLKFSLGNLVFPVILLLFGLHLLSEALKKPKKPVFSFQYNSDKKHRNSFEIEEESFSFDASFGQRSQVIVLPRLKEGDISVSFGEYTIDLSGVQMLAPECEVEADCSFGELTILVPKRFTVRLDESSAFGNIDISGHSAPDATQILRLDANASFGEISIQYI